MSRGTAAVTKAISSVILFLGIFCLLAKFAIVAALAFALIATVRIMRSLR